MDTDLKILIIGIGYWGPNILRNVEKFKNIIVSIAEPDKSKWGKIKNKEIKIYESLETALQNDEFDGVIICSPISTHPKLVKRCLTNNLNVLCQKPVFRNKSEYENIIPLINNSVLMAAHTFIYNPAIQNIKKNINSLGNIRYYKSTRINLGLFNRDNNVLDDLGIHDMSILTYLFPNEEIEFISATGTDQVKKGVIDTANITVKYKSGIMANIDLSWVSAVKNRQLIIVGDKKTVVYDDCKTENKVCYYDSGVDYDEQLLFSYKKGDMFSPRLEETEAIYNELQEFFDCIINKREPLSGGAHLYKTTLMLEAANRSVAKDGCPVYNLYENDNDTLFNL